MTIYSGANNVAEKNIAMSLDRLYSGPINPIIKVSSNTLYDPGTATDISAVYCGFPDYSFPETVDLPSDVPQSLEASTEEISNFFSKHYALE